MFEVLHRTHSCATSAGLAPCSSSSSIYSQPIRLSAIESSSRYQTRKPSTWDPEPSVVFFRLMWCSWLKCDVVACGRAHSRSRLRSSAGNRGQGPPEAYIHICIDIYAHVQIYIQIYIHTHPYGDRGQGPPETSSDAFLRAPAPMHVYIYLHRAGQCPI